MLCSLNRLFNTLVNVLNTFFFLSVSPKLFPLSNLLFFFKLSFVYSFFLIKKNQKIKAYAAGAKNTPLSRAERTRCAQTAFRFAGFPTYFFNAPSAEANPFHGSLSASPIFHARLRHRLLPGCLLRKSAPPLPNSEGHPQGKRRCRRRAAKEDPTSSERALRNP